MESNSRMVHWVVWSGLAVVILAICFAFVREQGGGGAAPSNPGLAKAGKPPVISQLTDFTLTNQLDQPVRLARFADKVVRGHCVYPLRRAMPHYDQAHG